MSHATETATCDHATDCKQPKVLMIDDDPNVLQALERRFRPYNVSLLKAYHGAHGIWLATTERPDVIITDLKMPNGQGQDVVECLRNNSDTCHIPIIVLTGVRDSDLRKRLLHSGVAAYLMKPLNFEVLREALAHLITLEEKTLRAAQ